MARQLYESAKDRTNQRRALDKVASYLKAECSHFDSKSKADAILHDKGNVLGYLEYKKRNFSFGYYSDGYKISHSKVDALRELADINDTHSCLVIEFDDCIGILDAEEKCGCDPNWGREDRDDPLDKGIAAVFRWNQFKCRIDNG